STGRTNALPPAASTSRRAPSRPSSPRAINPIEAPRRANSRAVARPTPADAPVMTTTSPLATLHPCTSNLIRNLGCEVFHHVCRCERSMPGIILSLNDISPTHPLALFQVIEGPQDRSKDGVRQNHCHRRPYAIMQGQKTRRFEAAVGGGTGLLTGHSGVQARQQCHQHSQYKERVQDSDDCTAPPSG